MNNQPPPLSSQPPPLLPYRQNRQSSRLATAAATSFVAACALIMIFVAFGGGSSKPSSKNPSRQEVAKSQRDGDFDHDFYILWNVKTNAVERGLATNADISGWTHSVDLTIGSRNAAKADMIADAICHNANLGLIDRKWKVRIYISPMAAFECRTTN